MEGKIFMPPPPKELKQNSELEEKKEINQDIQMNDVQSKVQFENNGGADKSKKIDAKEPKQKVKKENKSSLFFAICIIGLVISLGAMAFLIYLLI